MKIKLVRIDPDDRLTGTRTAAINWNLSLSPDAEVESAYQAHCLRQLNRRERWRKDAHLKPAPWLDKSRLYDENSDQHLQKILEKYRRGGP